MTTVYNHEREYISEDEIFELIENTNDKSPKIVQKKSND